MYLNKSYVLYKIMETLYKLRTYDFSYGKNIYKQLCLPFSSKLLNNYIEKRINNIKINNKVIKISSEFEDTYIQISRAFVIIKTNVNSPKILKIFNIYNRQIFVCDFDNIDYFWLNRQFKTTFKI